MKDSFWFKHDSGARNDPRLIVLRAEFGAAGYGCYFMLLEILREAHGFKLADDDWLPASLALSFGVSEEMINKFMARVVILGLLRKKDKFYYSDSFTRRMAEFIEVQKSYQERGRIGGLRKAELQSNPSPAIAQLQPSSSDRIGVDRIGVDRIELDSKDTDYGEVKDIPKDIIKEEPVKRKETAEAYIVRQFKIALGVPELDKDWDKACFARNTKAAVAIIGAFQNDKVYATEWARKKIEHWQKWAKETGKSFSLERIAIEAQNDKGKYLEEKARIEKYQRQEGDNDKQHTTAKMGTDYTVGQIKDIGLTQIGKAITPNINKPKER